MIAWGDLDDADAQYEFDAAHLGVIATAHHSANPPFLVCGSPTCRAFGGDMYGRRHGRAYQVPVLAGRDVVHWLRRAALTLGPPCTDGRCLKSACALIPR